MTAPLTWPECIALAERHHPTREKPGAVSGQAVATEIVPRTRPRGIRSALTGRAWERLSSIPYAVELLVAVPTTLVGWALLNLIDRVASGVTAAQAGLLS